jgi:A/G-specific adenine glycosylase
VGGADPASGGSRQSTFAGSDRQGRGRLVDALRHGPVLLDDVPAAAGWPDDSERAHRVAATLVADGLATSTGDALALP